MAFDFVVLTCVLWAVSSLRYNTLYWPPNLYSAAVLMAGPVITLITFNYAGLYRLVTRYLGSRGHTRIVGSITLAVLIWSLVVFMAGQLGTPRSGIIGFGAISAGAISRSGPFAAWVLRKACLPLPTYKPG